MSNIFDVPPTVTIPKAEYQKLQERDEFLSRLEAAGVDNWEGYGEAFRDDEVDGDEEDASNGTEDGSSFPGRDIVASEDEIVEDEE